MIREMNTDIYNNIGNFLKKRAIELLGLLLICLGVVLLISIISYSPNDPSMVFGDDKSLIQNYFGIYGSSVSDFLLQSFGLVSFLLIINIIAWGSKLLFQKQISKFFLRFFFIVLYLSIGCTFVYATFNNSFWLIDNGNSGFVGQMIYNYIYVYFPTIENLYINYLLGFFTIILFFVASNLTLKPFNYFFTTFLKGFFKKNNRNEDSLIYSNNEKKSEPTIDTKPQQSFEFEKKEALGVTRNKIIFKLPTLDLLEKNISKIDLSEANKNRPNSEFMEKILLDFGVSGSITKINNGPVVSLYEFEPAAGIKVSKIINLSDDLARNTSSTSARVSVIPGKNTVGIEIPNEVRESVGLKEIISNDKFKRKEIKLPIALGKSISGVPIISDLTNMPHLLIAGTTGSGKSVCINTIIVSLLYKLSPEICKFILIDPKMLELSSYEGIPHLLTPVITDAKKSTAALGWTVREMNNRYKLMSKVGVRNIDGYNSKHKLKMPYIVVVVDEMSDLMLVAGKEIENYIQKLSQMARAAGIHIIMATQRPSVDVITGTIKANFPTRISFQVSSKIDSRTILGEQGAEQLLGKGDMLFMSSANRIVRIHGPFVSENEIEKITSVLRAQGEPDYIEDIILESKIENNDASGNADDDELYSEALNIIKSEGKASTSFLQRKLQIGYNRAARIIDMMEERGVVSKANHVGKREVL
ncbi:MAG: DNA segregation ATPase FtsK/SpoIIIE, S-DNA-T family [Pelagibacterales bacterium]|nr:DNA segregation ATPase FtsK/SpoIIIE, S-DNA-T family [Pelagibacterales bacterium]